MRHLSSPSQAGRSRALIAAFVALTLACAFVAMLADNTPARAAPTSPNAASTFDIGVIYSSPQTDGWGAVNINALKAAMARVGDDRFTLKVVDSLPFTSQMTQTAEQLFQQGAELVVDISSAGPLFYTACDKFPKGYCLELYPVGQAAANSSGWWTDAGVMLYLEGMAAGKLTKSGTVGFVNAFKIPAQVALLNQYALGCRAVRPTCKIRNIYINSFSDASKAAEATNTLINAGADVVNYWTNTNDVLVTSSRKNVWSFGLYRDQRSVAPSRYVTSFLLQPTLTRIFEQELRSLVGGNWAPGRVNYGTPVGTIDIGLAPWGANVPASVKATVEAELKKIRAGKNPYVGPIYDSKGTLRVPKGKKIALRTGLIYGKWDWTVRGVIGG